MWSNWQCVRAEIRIISVHFLEQLDIQGARLGYQAKNSSAFTAKTRRHGKVKNGKCYNCNKGRILKETVLKEKNDSLERNDTFICDMHKQEENCQEEVFLKIL